MRIIAWHVVDTLVWYYMWYPKVLTRDSKGLTEEQLHEFRQSFNHFDKVVDGGSE